MANTYEKILYRGYQENIDKTAIENGKLRFAIDTRRLFMDTENQRIEFTDLIRGFSYSEIKDLEDPLPKIYLSSDTHQLLVYDPMKKDWNEYGNGDGCNFALKAKTDNRGQIIDETYVKNAYLNDDGDLILIYGNGKEQNIGHIISSVIEKAVSKIEDELQELRDAIEIIKAN